MVDMINAAWIMMIGIAGFITGLILMKALGLLFGGGERMDNYFRELIMKFIAGVIFAVGIGFMIWVFFEAIAKTKGGM